MLFTLDMFDQFLTARSSWSWVWSLVCAEQLQQSSGRMIQICEDVSGAVFPFIWPPRSASLLVWGCVKCHVRHLFGVLDHFFW